MSDHTDQKPSRFWRLRKRIGAFTAACTDSDTRYVARATGRDGVISVASFATAGAFLKISATAITSFILGYGLPIAAGAGAILAGKSFYAYKKSAQSRKKSTHVRDGLLAAGMIAGAAFLLSTGAAATVAMVVGIGAPVAAGAGALMGFKTWRGMRALNTSMPARRYLREAEEQWIEKKNRAPLTTRMAQRVKRIASAPFKLFSRKDTSVEQNAPALVQTAAQPRLEAAASTDFAQTATTPKDDAAQARADARARRKAEGPRF